MPLALRIIAPILGDNLSIAIFAALATSSSSSMLAISLTLLMQHFETLLYGTRDRYDVVIVAARSRYLPLAMAAEAATYRGMSLKSGEASRYGLRMRTMIGETSGTWFCFSSPKGHKPARH